MQSDYAKFRQTVVIRLWIGGYQSVAAPAPALVELTLAAWGMRGLIAHNVVDLYRMEVLVVGLPGASVTRGLPCPADLRRYDLAVPVLLEAGLKKILY
jgi:hypothetical protein